MVYGPLMNLSGLGKIEGQNLLFLDDKDLKKELLKNNFLLKDIMITKVYPDKLHLYILEKEPVAFLISSSSALLISEEGIILKKKDKKNEMNIPVIEGEKEGYKIGDKLDSLVTPILTLSKEINNLYIDAETIKIDKKLQEATFVTADGTQIVLSLTKSNTTLPASLQIIMSRFRIEGTKPSRIDFRFDKPIVTLINGDKISP